MSFTKTKVTNTVNELLKIKAKILPSLEYNELNVHSAPGLTDPSILEQKTEEFKTKIKLIRISNSAIWHFWYTVSYK